MTNKLKPDRTNPPSAEEHQTVPERRAQAVADDQAAGLPDPRILASSLLHWFRDKGPLCDSDERFMRGPLCYADERFLRSIMQRPDASPLSTFAEQAYLDALEKRCVEWARPGFESAMKANPTVTWIKKDPATE